MTLQDNLESSFAGCVVQNLGFVYIKKSDFDRFMRVILQCSGINPSRALYGCVICALTNVEKVSLHFVDVVQVFNSQNFGVISDNEQYLSIQNLNLENSLVENFWYRQSRKFSRRATKIEVFQTLQRIIKLDGFEQVLLIDSLGHQFVLYLKSKKNSQYIYFVSVRMDPKAFQIAMEQVNRMTPEQLAEMQRQAQNINPEMAQHAMRQMQNMSADDWRRLQDTANNMTPQQMAERSQNAAGQFQAQQKYMQQGAVALKEEGNALHKLGNFSGAADKYEQALNKLGDLINSSEVADLSKACRLNLASCYLKLARDQECVQICDDILQVDRENMKALYRRGQALGNLGRYSAATTDLKHAKRLVGSDAQQLALIQEKLSLFESRIQQDFVVEEIDETPQRQYNNSSSQENQPIIQDAAQFNDNQQQNQNFNFGANQEQILQAAMQIGRAHV
eukprot:TRINITY_DN9533_c0_g3_i2.p1 TRINITY_DN9533_c0_g3~~TRINITY_DN9533_c0_g3_i2.p1  ORF type:complete len:449 (+),score=54.60 TRINITY_DN9533_c0_g3_i2:134-1480(+)